MIKIYVLHISRDLSQDEFHSLSYLITKEKIEKIKRFHKYADMQRSIFGDTLARYSVCTNFNLLNADLRFDTNKNGKPFVLNNPDIQYNISHAGCYVVCAVSNNIPVGIDVEVIQPFDMKIAKRFFTREEYEYIKNFPAELQAEAFYRIWTLKESYIKMIGTGLSIPLNSFNVLSEISTNHAYFQQFIKNEKIIGNICVERSDTISCHEIGYLELLTWSTYKTI